VFTGHYTYLLLNVLTVIFPLILSFDKKVAFYKKWKYFLPAMGLTALVFLIWDIWFTKTGVWSFNPDFLLGINLINLPVEEWLFFITVPYACVFIYECLRCWFQIRMSGKIAAYISVALASILIVVAAINHFRIYTSTTFILLGVFIMIQFIIFRNEVLRNFIPAYLIAILPFFLVNGVLTSNPVVIYNNAENFGFRIGTVPIEDLFYGMLLVLMNVTFMEIFRHGVFARKIKFKFT